MNAAETPGSSRPRPRAKGEILFAFRDFSRPCAEENFPPGPATCFRPVRFQSPAAEPPPPSTWRDLPRRGIRQAGTRTLGPSLSPHVFAGAFGRLNAGADFSSASSDFKVLGALFCNFATLPFLRLVAHGQPRARVPHLVVRGFRAHTISRRGFNPFKPLRRHFPATPYLAVSLSRRAVAPASAVARRIAPLARPAAGGVCGARDGRVHGGG